MSDGPAISIRNLVKRYGGSKGAPGKLALDGVSFDVPQGGIFGLLGPNGAGKSTLINILAGLVMKTSGTAEIWGFDIDRDRRNAKRAIGIVPQEIVFDPFFTPAEVLEIQAGLYGIAPAMRSSCATSARECRPLRRRSAMPLGCSFSGQTSKHAPQRMQGASGWVNRLGID